MKKVDKKPMKGKRLHIKAQGLKKKNSKKKSTAN